MTASQLASGNALGQDPPRCAHTKNMSLSLTLALKDGALGTTPLSHQQTTVSLLKADVRHVAAAMPRILSAALTSMVSRRREVSWVELRELSIYILVSLLELQLLFSVCLLWLAIPGLALLPWLGLHIASIWFLLQCVNHGRGPFTLSTGELGGDHSGSEEQHSEWFVVGGLGMHRKLAPKLAKVFGHDMHIFLPCRLGFPLDMLLMLLQRNLHISTTRSAALYYSVRASLLKPETSGVRILAHNTGALDIAWLLARLCADLPPGDRLSKLQVFTFGAASIEMTLPLGSTHKQGEDSPAELYPSITHFAFNDDPFAQIGVLLGVRQRLEGRFIGSLYTIHSATMPSTGSRWLPLGYHYTFDDYLDALLPNGDPRAGILGQVCKVDRELSEMRELAALAQSVTNERLRTRRVRLSWTALGVVANSMSSGHKDRDDMVGPLSLEEVRKKGRALEGLRGYDSNPLADVVRNRHYLRSSGRVAGPDVTETYASSNQFMSPK
ncbi:hypothetical protein F4677DRAFT_232371 [Hypoxylon crocopeplum]|nr:hypothetical protein F4677DRAFT_232371 [Hypoxylon crocopeplum]